MHGESDDDEDVGSQLDASEEEGSEEEAEEGEEEDESEEEESVDDAEDESEASEDEDEKASDEDSENDAQDSEFEQEGTEPSEKRVEKALTSLEAATSIDSPSPPASSSLVRHFRDAIAVHESILVLYRQHVVPCVVACRPNGRLTAWSWVKLPYHRDFLLIPTPTSHQVALLYKMLRCIRHYHRCLSHHLSGV